MNTPLLFGPGGPRPTALVTGGGRRIGKAIALALAQQGWRLAIHFHQSRAQALEVVGQIQQGGGNAVAFQRDFSGAQAQTDLDHWFALIAQECGPIGLLVNNASQFEFDLASDATAESLNEHFHANAFAPILLIQALFRQVQSGPAPSAGQSAAVVINLLDQKLSNLNPDFFSYTLSKAALAQAIPLMALSLAPWLRIIGLSPGFTMIAKGQSQTSFEQAHQVSPLGASSSPEEIAAAVCWLAQARAVTGSTILVDGGQHLLPSSRDLQFIDSKT